MDALSNELFELLAILFVSHGSSGSHLLFKYPFSSQHRSLFKSTLSEYSMLINTEFFKII
jgi:hypothetical protein